MSTTLSRAAICAKEVWLTFADVCETVFGAFGTLVWSITHALTGLLLTGATSLALIFFTSNSTALGPLTCFTKVTRTTFADTLKFTILLHLFAFSTVVASRW